MVPDGNSGYHDQEHVYNEVRQANFSWENKYLIMLGRDITVVFLHMAKQAAAKAIQWFDMGKTKELFQKHVMKFSIEFERYQNQKCFGLMSKCQCWKFITNKFKIYLLTQNQIWVKTCKFEKVRQWAFLFKIYQSIKLKVTMKIKKKWRKEIEIDQLEQQKWIKLHLEPTQSLQ